MHSDPLTHLPDPVRQHEFYQSVTAKRGFAWLIDLVLVAILTTIISIVTIVGVFIFPLIWLVVDFFYRWITISRGSSTLGMRIMAIELRDAWGQRLDVSQAAMHTVGYMISYSMFLVQLISIGLMFGSQRGQGLTDMVLGTVMLNRRA